MIFQWFSYFRFLMRSKNQHGVHSPFVYDYLTKGLYQNKKISSKGAKNRWLEKTLHYFKPSKIYCFETVDTKLAELIQPDTLTHKFEEASLLIARGEFSEQWLEETIHRLQPEQYLLIQSKKYDKRLLQQLIEDPSVRVSIDFYHSWFISKRLEQVKEHFFLRAN